MSSETAIPDGQRVLVVDDNQDACELLAERLQQAGYQVELAHDGRAALAAARNAGCQIALVDLGLPDMDGFEVCRTLKAERPQLYVVALTGYSDQGARDRAKQAGFDRFLVKPLDSRRVLSTLSELLGQRGS
ncbi:MAG TPA: response regulator [Kofleriaceae bacterium]|jgi:two-component system CheB/CheR fusion protein